MSLMLSVIVPLHNAGSLFEPFLASLLAQHERRLEVIIVNDGSTDGSGDIAHRYAAQHPHIRVIDQANAGVSNARNAGLAIARGKYVAFPDADDLLAPEMYSTLLEQAEKHQLDVMQCNGERYFASRMSLSDIPSAAVEQHGGDRRRTVVRAGAEVAPVYSRGVAGDISS